MLDDRVIAYFSMEIGLEPAIPTYSGGLGMLAGDSIRSAADLRVPMEGVSLLHRKGYFFQRLDGQGHQAEEPVDWVVDDYLRRQPVTVHVEVEGRSVAVAAWCYEVRGTTGYVVPVYLLDTDLAENQPEDRAITDALYGGDHSHRLIQEAVLGIAGVRALRALGHHGVRRYHMNEGHAAFLVLELLQEEARQRNMAATDPQVLEAVRPRCVFTTHTPVPAGHDQFDTPMVRAALGEAPAAIAHDVLGSNGTINMTALALSASHFVNGVAKRHGEVSRGLFPNTAIDSITNGVHVGTWACPSIRKLFDLRIPGWREDNFMLRHALAIGDQEIWDAHTAAKRRLIEVVNHMTNAGLDVDVMTIGFARRATAYKRPELLLSDPERLRAIAGGAGPFQVIFGGKAHPRDHQGKEIIARIHAIARELHPQIRVVFLENYDFALAQLLIPGVDLWLNTPQPPMEASGTSGMKAAINGVPQLSTLDGWWLEGCLEGLTGWSIGTDRGANHFASESARDADSLYGKLEHTILPMFYKHRHRYVEIMRHAIAVNGSYFNTQRMMLEYVTRAYVI